MRAVSRAWARTMAGSFTPMFRATLCTEYQTGTSPHGERLRTVPGGGVVIDGLADVRTTASISLPSSYWPRHGYHDTGPWGNELYLQAGVRYSDELCELVGLGYLRIEAPEQDDAARGGPVTLTLVDRMQGIIDARLETPKHFPASTTAGALVLDLVTEVYPLAEVEWDDDSDLATLGRDIFMEEDRYAGLKDVADSLGKIMYWNHRGALAFEAMPNVRRPVAQISSGRDGVLVSASRRLSREGVYNAVVARGDGLDQTDPVYAVAYDGDPNSMTYYLGRYGKVPKYYASPFLTTSAQALAAASAILRKGLGTPYQVNFGMSPNYALQPFDPVRISHPHSAPEIHVIATLDFPWGAGGVALVTTMEQTNLTVGEVTA